MIGLDTYLAIPAPPVEPPEVVHAGAMARGAQCTICPLYGCGRGPVLGEIRRGSYLSIVGEAPGPNEVEGHRPFIGWSGNILEMALGAGGLIRANCSITNTILCQPPDGGNFQAYQDSLVQRYKRDVKRAQRGYGPMPAPLVLPHQACAPRLSWELAQAMAPVYLAVGKRGLEACARELNVPQGNAQVASGDAYVASIKKQHGAPVILPDGRVLMSSYHPAMAAPGRSRCEYLPVIRENLSRAAAVARAGGRIDWQEPYYELNPTATEVEAFCSQLVSLRAEVAVDIESGPSAPGRKDGADVYANITRCVGIGARLGPEGRLERVMVVPFRHMDGSEWWGSYDDKIRAALALRSVMDTCPLIMQNGQFDTAVMLRVGLMSEASRWKRWTDTMLLHHDTPDNDLPHDLGFIARRYFCFPLWKSDIDHKSVDNVNDANLHLYNARDVLVTLRCVEPLRKEVEQWGTQPQYETDTALSPVLREMGHLGLVVDEARRGQFSGILNWQSQRELYRFREIIGEPKFNPRSVNQLQELIFQTWGYVPVLGMDQYEIERKHDATWKEELLAEADEDMHDEIEEEVGSTSSAALIELMKKREMREEHVRAIETLLEYRAYDKLRGTYVDNLKVRPVAWEMFGYKVGNVDSVSALVWDSDSERYAPTELLPLRRALSLLNTQYKNHVIPTGRLATQPAVQNWPALGKANMRDMIVAPPGHMIVGADYAQLEARLYAVAAQDQLLLEAIRVGRDIHSMNAAALLAKNLGELDYWYKRVEENSQGLPKDEWKAYRKYWRTVAKRFAFLEIYGGEKDKLFSVMAQQRDKVTGQLSFPNLKRSDVDRWHDNWHNLHPWTSAWHEYCHQLYEETGYATVPAIDWRKRFFLGGLSKKNAVPNMTIQGFASSIANRALLRLVEAIPFRSWSPWTGPVLQVHDYIGMYVPENRADEAKKILAECMYYEYAGVPFPAEAGKSRRWSGQD